MVIGRSFAWSHLPKTGGTATLEMFGVFPDLIEHADARDSEEQHATFADRADAVAGKLLLLNIRILPAWILSRAEHVARFGVWPDFRPIPMPPASELSRSTLPDERLAQFTAGVRIDRWLRMEHLAVELLAFVETLRDVTADERGRVEGIGAVNANDYEHDAAAHFTPDQIRAMYARNPRWAALEAELYRSV